MKNRPFLNAFKNSRSIAVIGVKGIPPEFPGTSGVEFYVSSRLPFLAAAGAKVVCYVRNWATPRHIKTHNEAVLVHLPSVSTLYFDAVSHSFLATVHACFSQVDTVWYQAAGPAMFSFLPRIFGKKVVVTLHTLEWKRKKWEGVGGATLLFAERVAVHSAHELLVVSRELARYCQSVYSRDCYIDTPLAHPPRRVPAKIISDKYGLHKDRFVLYLGRFVPEKRIEWLIRAFQKTSRAGIRLVLAGGAHHMDKYAVSLRKLAGNDARICFVGWVFGKEKEELLANCLLFVLPSSVEGNPVVLYELPDDRRALVSEAVARLVTHRGRLSTFPESGKSLFEKKLRELINDDRIKH